MSIYNRTERLIGKEAQNKLKKAYIAVFGIGGVGSYVVEALARAGIGSMDLIDADVVTESNINRQLIALQSTIGQKKAQVAADRIHDIHPDCQVSMFSLFFGPDNADLFAFEKYDFVIDAIDSVTGKLTLIERCKKAKTPIISCMGTGNKLYPELFKITDIEKTSMCPLAKVMRYEARKRGLGHFDVLFSTEEPLEPLPDDSLESESSVLTKRRSTPASISFVPSCAGLMIAGYVIRKLIGLC